LLVGFSLAQGALAQAGTLSGTVLATLTGDLEGVVVVACFPSSDGCDDAKSKVAPLSAGGQSANFSLSGLLASEYLILAWKDSNGNGELDAGDEVGVAMQGGKPLLVKPPAKSLQVQMQPFDGDVDKLFAAAQTAPAQSSASASGLAELAYALPAGWQEDRGAEPITLKFSNVITVMVYAPRNAPGGPLRAFQEFWQERMELLFQVDKPPFVMRRKVGGGLNAYYFDGFLKPQNNQTELSVTLLLLDAGTQAVPLLALSGGDEAQYRQAREGFLKGLKLQGSPPNRPLFSAWELVGSWSGSDSAITNYVNAYTGAYAGSQITAYGQTYTFKADGSYEYSFAGISGGRTIREKQSGRYRLEGNLLSLSPKEGKASQMRVLGVGPTADGKALLLLFSLEYEDRPANVRFFGEWLVRK